MKIATRPVRPARIEMLPLIDIVFLLLVFFIYAMLSMAVHRGLQMDLPESTEAETTEQESLSISLKNEGLKVQVYLDENPVDLSELGRILALEKEREPKVQLLVFADKSISYQELYRVLDQVKKSGIGAVSLQAELE